MCFKPFMFCLGRLSARMHLVLGGRCGVESVEGPTIKKLAMCTYPAQWYSMLQSDNSDDHTSTYTYVDI